MANRQQRRAAAKEAEPVEGSTPAPSGLPTDLVLKGTNGELKIRLAVPRLLGVRNEITWAAIDSDIKAACAALGVCSGTIQKHVPWTKRSNALVYGGDVLEWLLSQGVAYPDIVEAAGTAYWHISRGLIPAREVDEAEGFSGPTTVESTG